MTDANDTTKRLDGIQASVQRIEERQSQAHNDAQAIRHRVDLLEKDMRHAEETSVMTYKTLAEAIDRNHKLTVKLFERFDTHCATEDSDRKRILFWMITAGISAAGGALMFMANKVFQ
jgi:predicted nuclease with TOPRIM domain